MSRDNYKVDVPEGTSGDWTISRDTVSAEDEGRERMFAVIRRTARFTPRGTYTVLRRNGRVVMSDTPDEILDHREAVYKASGRCFIAGLGIGMVAQAMLLKPEVDRVTIVEKSMDVFRLTGPWLMTKFPGRVTIVVADALTWVPPRGERWDAAWFDIWDEPCSDHLDEMKALHKRFARKAAWKGSWARDRCERLAQEDHRRFGRFRGA